MLLGRTETLKHDGGLRRTRIEEAHSEHGWVQRQILGQKSKRNRSLLHEDSEALDRYHEHILYNASSQTQKAKASTAPSTHK